LLDLFDFTPLSERFTLDYLTMRRALITRAAAGPTIVVYNEQLRPRLELEVVAQQGYASRAGREYPLGGLRAVRLWAEHGDSRSAHDLHARPILLPPR
jgi:hypothetical protein